MTSSPSPDEGAGHGPVWRLAGPIILSNLSTPLLGAVDTAVVGRLPDPAYIGGVAIGAVIFSFVFWAFGFLRMGTTGFTAQAFGAGDHAELRAALLRPLLLAVALGMLLILLQLPIALVAFRVLDASAAVEGFAADYYAIRIWSAPAAFINYALLGWLLGTRRAGAALALQVGLNGLNILLDVLFVIGFGWGIEGVAWATLLSEVLTAAVGGLLVLRLVDRIPGTWDWQNTLRTGRLAALFKVNFDIFVRTLLLIISFSYFTAKSATFGDVTLAANAILMHFFSIMSYGLDGFAHAVEILAGNALGAGRRDAFRKAVVTSALWSLATAFIFTALYATAGPQIVGLFTDQARRAERNRALLDLGHCLADGVRLELLAGRHFHRRDPNGGHAQRHVDQHAPVLRRLLVAYPRLAQSRTLAGAGLIHAGPGGTPGGFLPGFGTQHHADAPRRGFRKKMIKGSIAAIIMEITRKLLL